MEPGDPVDQIGPQQGGGELSAALDQHPGHARLGRAPASHPPDRRRRGARHRRSARRPSLAEGTPAVRDRRLRGSAIQVGTSRAVATRLRSSGVRRWLSATTRTAGRGAEARDAAGQLRVVGQHGADADHHRVVPAAQRVRRARAAPPVIHWLSPAWVAIRPSSVDASFSVTSGRPGVIRLAEAGDGLARPRSASRPSSTRSPAVAQPGDALRHRRAGRDRRSPTTTRATPAAISASVQGGVRPQWQQGSSVT